MRKPTHIKDDLHALIDKIDDNELLEMVYQLLDSKNNNPEGELIKSLSEDQKKDLYESYEESQNESNLIDLKKLSVKHSKWLEK